MAYKEGFRPGFFPVSTLAFKFLSRYFTVRQRLVVPSLTQNPYYAQYNTHLILRDLPPIIPIVLSGNSTRISSI
jgi:hypothetical protein